MSTITEPDAVLNFNPRNEADEKIAARLTEIWETNSGSWTIKQKHEFQKLCSIARVTPSTCHASSHKIHRGIHGRKATEAEYIVLTAMFGTKRIHNLAWGAVFRRREEQYPIDEGVLTAELKKKIQASPRKGKTANAEIKTQDKDIIPETGCLAEPSVECAAKTSPEQDKGENKGKTRSEEKKFFQINTTDSKAGLSRPGTKSNAAEGPSLVEQHLVQIRGDIEKLTKALGNVNNRTDEDGQALVPVRRQATERPVIPIIETDHVENNEPRVKQEEQLQAIPSSKRKLGNKPNPQAARPKKTKTDANQEPAATSKVSKKAWTTKVLTEKVKELEACCAAYDERIKALEALISAKTEALPPC